MVNAFNLRTQEAETLGPLWFWGKSGLYNKFQDSQSYIERSCLKRKKKEREREEGEGKKERLNIFKVLMIVSS